MRAYRPAARRLAADRYVVGIAAEGSDVSLDPAERHLLVLETEIAAAGQRRKREKAQRAQISRISLNLRRAGAHDQTDRKGRDYVAC